MEIHYDRLYHQFLIRLDNDSTEKLYNQTAIDDINRSKVDDQNVSNFLPTEQIKNDPID
jgi:hypothetical protein